MNDRSVFFWIPLPPPYAGPEVASALLAEAVRSYLPRATIENATLRSNNMGKGRFDASGLLAFARRYPTFVRGVAASDVVYLVAAASRVGCVRDAVLITTARLMRRDIVLHLRGGRYDEYYRNSSSLMRRLLRFSWGSASRAIVQAPRLRNLLSAAAPEVDVCVLPNGLRGDSMPAKSSYATSAPRILFVGHLSYAKGFYDLMHAFRIIRASVPNAVLVCAGELPTGDKNVAEFLPTSHRDEYLPRRHDIADEIRAFVRSDNVEYVGVVSGDDKSRMFRSADVFVLPSYAEGFSVALLEAMFHGLPVVTTTVGANPDVITDGANGFLVAPGEVEALTRAVTTLIENEALRERFGRENAARARADFDLDRVAQRLAAIVGAV